MIKNIKTIHIEIGKVKERRVENTKDKKRDNCIIVKAAKIKIGTEH